MFQSIKCRGACPCAKVEDPNVEDPKVSWGGFGFGGSLLDQTKRMWHGQTSSFSDGKRVRRGLLDQTKRIWHGGERAKRFEEWRRIDNYFCIDNYGRTRHCPKKG